MRHGQHRAPSGGRVAAGILAVAVAALVTAGVFAGLAFAGSGSSPATPPAASAPTATQADLGVMYRLPPRPASAVAPVKARAARPAARTCRVQAGEGLWQVAARCLGDGHDWTVLAQVNHLSQPYVLQPGQLLSS